jgi:hypothetical protein
METAEEPAQALGVSCSANPLKAMVPALREGFWHSDDTVECKAWMTA